MIKKKYYPLAEAAQLAGCESADLIHLGATGQLPIHILADGWWVELFSQEIPDVPPHDVGPDIPWHKESQPQQFSAAAQLFVETLARYEANQKATTRRFIAPDDPDSPPGLHELRLCDEVNGKHQDDIRVGAYPLVVMAHDIPDLKKRIANDGDKPLGAKERNSLLTLVIGMAMGGYGYDPRKERQDKVNEICDDVVGLGLSLDDDTVRKWLRQAANLLPPKPPE